MFSILRAQCVDQEIAGKIPGLKAIYSEHYLLRTFTSVTPNRD